MEFCLSTQTKRTICTACPRSLVYLYKVSILNNWRKKLLGHMVQLTVSPFSTLIVYNKYRNLFACTSYHLCMYFILPIHICVMYIMNVMNFMTFKNVKWILLCLDHCIQKKISIHVKSHILFYFIINKLQLRT